MTDKVRLIRPGVLAHPCPGCDEEHSIALGELDDNGRRVGWNGSFTHPSIGGPVRHETARGPCGYELRGGEIHFTDDSWHALAGRCCPMQEISQ